MASRSGESTRSAKPLASTSTVRIATRSRGPAEARSRSCVVAMFHHSSGREREEDDEEVAAPAQQEMAVDDRQDQDDPPGDAEHRRRSTHRIAAGLQLPAVLEHLDGEPDEGDQQWNAADVEQVEVPTLE